MNEITLKPKRALHYSPACLIHLICSIFRFLFFERDKYKGELLNRIRMSLKNVNDFYQHEIYQFFKFLKFYLTLQYALQGDIIFGTIQI